MVRDRRPSGSTIDILCAKIEVLAASLDAQLDALADSLSFGQSVESALVLI